MNKINITVKISLFIVIVAIGLYALTLRGTAGNPISKQSLNKLSQATYPFESSHERATYSQVLAIVKDHQFNLNKTLADFSTPDVGYLKGKFYSYFPPGVSFLITPLYLIGQYFNMNLLFAYGTISIVSTISLIFLFLVARSVLKLPNWISLFIVFVYGFASISWSYAITIYQHIPAVYLLLSSFYFVWRYKNSMHCKLVWAMLIWFNFGISFMFDYPNPILLSPIMVYFLLESIKLNIVEKKLHIKVHLAFFGAIGIFICIMAFFGFYNYKAYGNWKTLANNLPRYEITNLVQLQNHITNDKTSGVKLASTFLEERIPSGLYELTVAADKGVFVFSPIYALVALALFIVLKKNKSREISVLLAIVLVNIFLYASFGDPWGGWAYGPRYLIPSLAVSSLFIGMWLQSVQYSLLKRIIAFILFIVSSSFALLGVLTTNAVPPKVEAVYLKIKYGIAFNIDYLTSNRSGSVVFNTFFIHKISLLHYFLIIECVLSMLIFIMLFILPRLEKK